MAYGTSIVLARVDGWGITTPDLSTAIETIVSAAKSAPPFTVFTLNLDHIVKLRRAKNFRVAYRNAAIVTADGAPVAWLARFQNKSIERTTGADIFLPLMDAAARDRLPVFVCGTSADVITRAGSKLCERTSGRLNISGTYAPSQNFDPNGPEADAVIARIRRSSAKLCVIGIGAPKQEILAERVRSSGVTCGIICIGAALDFIAETQTRAPAVFRNHGLEWAWRLAGDPRRLARRYANCAVVLADLAVVAPLRQRLASAAARIESGSHRR
ncbi:MAG: WecB/TagA/CpsF family glycosyltransferase [Hyphomicrobium sp.]